jgi:hypothetical protein
VITLILVVLGPPWRSGSHASWPRGRLCVVTMSRKEVEQLVYALSSSSEVLRLTRSGDRDGLGGLQARLWGYPL